MPSERLQVVTDAVALLEDCGVEVKLQDVHDRQSMGDLRAELQLTVDGSEAVQSDSGVSVDETPVAEPTSIPCPECDETFRSGAKLGVHLADDHGDDDREIRSVDPAQAQTDVHVATSAGDHAPVADTDESEADGPTTDGGPAEDDADGDADDGGEEGELVVPDGVEGLGERQISSTTLGVTDRALRVLGVGDNDKVEVLTHHDDGRIRLFAGPDPDLRERSDHVSTYSVSETTSGTLLCNLTSRAITALQGDHGQTVQYEVVDDHVEAVRQDDTADEADLDLSEYPNGIDERGFGFALVGNESVRDVARDLGWTETSVREAAGAIGLGNPLDVDAIDEADVEAAIEDHEVVDA